MTYFNSFRATHSCHSAQAFVTVTSLPYNTVIADLLKIPFQNLIFYVFVCVCKFPPERVLWFQKVITNRDFFSVASWNASVSRLLMPLRLKRLVSAGAMWNMSNICSGLLYVCITLGWLH